MASHSDISSLAGKRVMVTGASGFTGRYVVDAFRACHCEVVGFSSSSEGAVNLLDREDVEDAVRSAAPDIVVHLAAISFVAHGDVDEIYRVNIVGTRNLLSALSKQAQRPQHVLLASSANVYGNAGGHLDECTPAAPVNDYAISKFAMELMARQFEADFSITVVRPFNYTGVGQSERFLIPKIVGHFKRGESKIELGNLEVSRDFNDVRNVADAYVRLAAAKPDGGGVFNIASGVEHTLMDVIAMMRDIAGYCPDIAVNPAFVRANEVRTLVGDPSRLNGVVGAMTQRPLRETLRWMFQQA